MIGRIAVALGLLVLAPPCFAADAACPAGYRARLELPATSAALSHDLPITIVALGSSSTEGAGASSPDRTYPAQLQSLLRDTWPEDQVTVLNRGIGGQMADQVVQRIAHDVIEAKPTLVIWQVGTNEALRGMDPATFETLLDQGLNRLGGIGADVVLMDYQLAPRMPAEPVASVYDDIIVRQAKAHRARLFSRTALMRAWLADGASGMIGPDGLHHSDRGYACLAASLETAVIAGAAPKVATVNSAAK